MYVAVFSSTIKPIFEIHNVHRPRPKSECEYNKQWVPKRHCRQFYRGHFDILQFIIIEPIRP